MYVQHYVAYYGIIYRGIIFKKLLCVPKGKDYFFFKCVRVENRFFHQIIFMNMNSVCKKNYVETDEVEDHHIWTL